MTHRVRATLALTALTALLVGCGGDDTSSPAADPTSPVATSASSASPSAPSSSPAPSVEPATGPAMSNTVYSLDLPDGWVESIKVGEISNIAHPKGHGDYSIISVEVADNYGAPTDFDKMIAIQQQTSPWPKKPKRVADATLGDESAYHLAGPSGSASAPGGPDLVLDVYGALYDGKSVTIEFALPGSPEERQAIVDSVLATWQWK